MPAAGRGSRIQPLACSKELLPVGSCWRDGVERPRAVSEYLLDRMVLAGADRIAFVIGPEKSDILHYYGGDFSGACLCYRVQPRPVGLCDAIFRALPLVNPSEDVLIGLPDTVWFPEDGFSRLSHDALSLLTFPVDRPELFDAVVCDGAGHVQRVEVKSEAASSCWIWGALRMRGAILHDLHALWRSRAQRDEYLGTLLNAYLAGGGSIRAVRAGERYLDVGSVTGYRRAVRLLRGGGEPDPRTAPAPLAAAPEGR